eukprot:2107086-Pyramimonas_sp.AAC.1
MIEEELNRHNIPAVFTRVLAEGIFVTNAFTFYNGVSPRQAHAGRQPSFLPDLDTLDFRKGPETSGHERERRVRE